MRLVGPGACAGFLVGGTAACPLVGLVPLVGRAVLRDVFIGSCELSVALGTLSADGWGCVPILLVVWPEVFQHWNLSRARP